MQNSISQDDFEQTILKYLKSQESYPEHLDLISQEIPPEVEIREILEDILFKVNKRVVCRERYENLRIWHNQAPLFDLNSIIPDFCIDENMMKKLAFKESLLISEIDAASDTEQVEPCAVGGLCLNVQFVEAGVTKDRAIPTDEAIDLEILESLKNAKKVLAKKPVDFSEVDLDLRKKLEEYENFLRNETQAHIKKFVVHLSSQFDVHGQNAGSVITSWVDRQLHTLEEKRIESVDIVKTIGPTIQQSITNLAIKYFRWIDTENGMLQKESYVAIQRIKYYVHHKSLQENFEDRIYYSFMKTRDLVCEGANFILMRYLAIINYIGTFELSTTYLNGSMCRNIYQCIGPVTGIIDDKEVEVCKIYRYIIEECGIEHHAVTVLTTHGHIISQEWDGCAFILNRNPVLYLGGASVTYERQILEKTWMNDLELLSKFLGYKTTAELHMKNFLTDHSELKDLLADYIHNILLIKPENILSFTMDYFQSLCPFKIGKIVQEDP